MLCSETTVLQVKILDLILVLSGSTHMDMFYLLEILMK